MSDVPSLCPKCGSNEIHHRKTRADWVCDQCEHAWNQTHDDLAQDASAATKPQLFLSYGRDRDGKILADRLCADLAAYGFNIWRDVREIIAGQSWQHEITDGLRSAQVVIYLMTAHSTRVSTDRESHDHVDSVCLGEIAYALFHPPPRPLVPVLAERGVEPPLAIFHLDYVDLQAWKQSEDQYQTGLRRLLDGIRAALRGKKRYRKWHHQLNPWDFGAFLNEKRTDFCGREWLFDEVDAWRASNQEPALLITGDPGVGKSALVAQLVFLNPGGQVLAYHCCQADTPETLGPARFVRSVAAMIAGKLPEYAARLDDPTVQDALSVSRCAQDPASAFEEGVLAQLEYVPAPAEGVRYLLIDALDEAVRPPAGGPTIIDLLASRLGRLPGWLRVVATTRKEPAVLDRLRGLRAQTIDAQDLRNRNDLARFLTQRLKSPNLAALLTAARLFSDQVSEHLLNKSAGNFLYLKQVLAGLEQGDIDFAKLDQLPPGLSGLYLRFFERHFPDATAYAGAREILGVLVAAQEPLTREELGRIGQLGPGDSLGRVLRQLSTFLRELPGPGGRVGLTLYHKSLADWLTDTSLEGSLHHIGFDPGHARLAEAGWKAYHRGVPCLSPYMLRHLPLHLTRSERWDDLTSLLTDLPYLEAKAEAGMAYALVGDFTEAVSISPRNPSAPQILRLVKEALLRDVHFINRHPTTLFQCLWNSCWWYDCEEAFQHYDVPSNSGQTNLRPTSHEPGGKLSDLLVSWRVTKGARTPGFRWVRSLRPPMTRLGTIQATFREPKDEPFIAEYSPDGRRVATVGNYFIFNCPRNEEPRWPQDTWTLRVWDARVGQELLHFHGQTAHTSLTFSPDSRRFLTSCYNDDDHAIRVWDAETGDELYCLLGHLKRISDLAYAPDGRRFASVSEDSTLRVWDSEIGRELFCLPDQDAESVAFSPDGRRIATGLNDGTIRIMDAGTGRELVRLRGHEGAPRAMTFSPDGRRIVSGGSVDKTVDIWDAHSGRELRSLRGHEDWVFGATYSADGRFVASGSFDGTARIWDAESGQQLQCLCIWDVESRPRNDEEDKVSSVAYSPDGRFLAVGYVRGVMRLWDLEGGEGVRRLRGHDRDVRILVFSPDGRQFTSGGEDDAARVWDTATGLDLHSLGGHPWAVSDIAYSPNGKLIVTADGTSQVVRVWDASTGQEMRSLEVREGLVWKVAVSADNRQVLCGIEKREPNDERTVSGMIDHIRTWDFERDDVSIPYSGNSNPFSTPSANGLSSFLATPDEHETVIRSATTGDAVAWFPEAVAAIASHPLRPAWAGALGNYVSLFTLEGGFPAICR